MEKVSETTKKPNDGGPLLQCSSGEKNLSASEDSYANLCHRCAKEKKSLEKMFKHYYTTEGERTSSPQPNENPVATDKKIMLNAIPEAYDQFRDTLYKPPTHYPMKGLNVIPFDVVTAHFVDPKMKKNELNGMQLRKKWRLKDCLKNLFDQLCAVLKPAKKNQEKKKLRTKVTEEPAKRTNVKNNNPARTTSEDCVKCAECSGPMDCSSDSLSVCEEDDYPVLIMTDCDESVCDCFSQRYLMNDSIDLFLYEDDEPRRGFRKYMCW